MWRTGGGGGGDDASGDDIYDARLLAVTDALADVERPGECFTSGSFSHFPLSGLAVDGLGEVRFPLGEAEAQTLVSHCHLAPYGHGEATIVDTQVRNTWELHADQFQLQNPAWRAILDTILAAIRAPLGISETTEYDARLYKLMLYETGGKFHTLQDSEKEMGMFGTLVVILPCRFTGGELLVQPPAAAADKKPPLHVWDPAALNAYDLKYAAFYGDSEHEVKPVASGFRLCLTYNLVTTTTATHKFFEDTRDETTQPPAKRLRVSTAAAPASTRVSFSRPPPPVQRDCQLVYVLEHKYTNPGLSFAYLKNKDHLVAQSLAKFCDDSRGAFALFLCKVKYTYEYDPDDDDVEFCEKSVALESPWVKFGDPAAVPCGSMTASLGAEIAPAGFFEEVPFDGTENHGYTGNAGSRAEKWYTSAALVVQPLKIELQQTARAGMDYAVTKWIRMVERGSPLAEPFASTVFAPERRWSTADLCFLPCLKAVRCLNNVEVFGDVLHSLSEVGFQALATTVEHFGWDACKDLVFEVAEALRLRSRVNLLCSVLHGVDDPARIAEVFAEVSLQPTLAVSPVSRFHYSFLHDSQVPADPSADARVLALARRVSPDKLRKLVATDETAALIKLVAPAMVAFVGSFGGGDDKPEPLVEIARSVVAQLRTRMPHASSWDLAHIRLHGGRYCCGHCTELQTFLSSRSQQTLRSKMNKQLRHHIHKVIEAYCGDRVSHETDRPSTLVMTKLLPAVGMHDLAQRDLRTLRALVGGGDADAASASIHSTPCREIIEIDSD